MDGNWYYFDLDADVVREYERWVQQSEHRASDSAHSNNSSLAAPSYQAPPQQTASIGNFHTDAASQHNSNFLWNGGPFDQRQLGPSTTGPGYQELLLLPQQHIEPPQAGNDITSGEETSHQSKSEITKSKDDSPTRTTGSKRKRSTLPASSSAAHRTSTPNEISRRTPSDQTRKRRKVVDQSQASDDSTPHSDPPELVEATKRRKTSTGDQGSKPFESSTQAVELLAKKTHHLPTSNTNSTYSNKFVTVQDARDRLNHVGSEIKYQVLIDKNLDDLHLVDDATEAKLRELLFKAITHAPAPAPSDLPQEDQQYLNLQHDIMFNAVMGMMSNEEGFSDAEAICVVLIDVVKKIHADGIPVANLKAPPKSKAEAPARKAKAEPKQTRQAALRIKGNYKVDTQSSFINRILKIAQHIQNDKYVAHDVLKQKGFFSLACAPDGYQAQKFANAQQNMKKKEQIDAGSSVLTERGGKKRGSRKIPNNQKAAGDKDEEDEDAGMTSGYGYGGRNQGQDDGELDDGADEGDDGAGPQGGMEQLRQNTVDQHLLDWRISGRDNDA